MTIQERVEKILQKYNPHRFPVLVALSGGADSICLLHTLHSLGCRLTAAHFNHNWRKESTEQALQVQRFCEEKYGIKCIVGHGVDVKKTEEDARNKRHAFLQEVYESSNCFHITLAHNAGDRAETCIMNMIRGCGLTGLTAMREYEEDEKRSIIRPLLDCTSEEIRAFCKENDLPVIHDSSNDDLSYTRNRIRAALSTIITDPTPFMGTLKTLEIEHHCLQVATQGTVKEHRKYIPDNEWLMGLRAIKLNRATWKDWEMERLLLMVREATNMVRGNVYDLKKTFFQAVVSLGINTEKGKTCSQDMTCFAWRDYLYLIKDYQEYQPWGPIEIFSPIHKLDNIGLSLYNRGNRGVLVASRGVVGKKMVNGKLVKKYLSELDIPPFMKERVPLILDKEWNPVEAWPSDLAMPLVHDEVPYE